MVLPVSGNMSVLKHRVLPAFALCLVAWFSLATGVARAGAPTLIPDGQFISEGALGVAVDQSTSGADPSRGDVYVAGFVTLPTNPATKERELALGRLNKFDAAGNQISPPSPEAFSYSGTAVNPANGDVYALEAVNGEIETYDPITGELLSSFPVLPSGNYSGPLEFLEIHTTVVGIATDSAGNIYVPVVPSNEVIEYSPAGTELATFSGSPGAGALKGPTSVSVDPSGNLWVADAGNDRIVELSPAGALIGEISSEGVQSVAVDAHDDVFTTVDNSADSCGKLRPPCPHLVEYGPTGAQLADLGAGSIGVAAAAQGNPNHLPDMVAVSDATGRVYVTEGLAEPPEGAHSRVFEFTPPLAPKLESELAVEVGASGVKLGAVVAPGGISAAYRFEYGTTTAYGNSVPFPEGDTGGGFQSRSVWASASGLQPGTTYHYRAVVTSDLGTVVGADQTFSTKTREQASCPNERLRTGFSAGLPDCRAYELVTPPNRSSAESDPTEENNAVEKSVQDNFAAVDGSRMSFVAEDIFPGSKSGGKSYVATRGSNGWSSENVFPTTNYYGYQCPNGLEISNYSADLSKETVAIASGGECGLEPELVSGEPRGVVNLFVRDNTDGAYQLVNVTPPGVTPANAELLARVGRPQPRRLQRAREADPRRAGRRRQRVRMERWRCAPADGAAGRNPGGGSVRGALERWVAHLLHICQ